MNILDNVLDFPYQVSLANDEISSLFEVTDHEEALKEAYKSSLKLANDSLNIADKIRKAEKVMQQYN